MAGAGQVAPHHEAALEQRGADRLGDTRFPLPSMIVSPRVILNLTDPEGEL